MAKFAKPNPEKQALNVIKMLDRTGQIPSVGTLRSYQQSLKNVATFLIENNPDDYLKNLDKEKALSYLDFRSEEVGQKTLDRDRQAMQAMMQYITHRLDPNESLPVVKSTRPQVLKSRSYRPTEINHIAAHQSEPNALATLIAWQSGLRAHELLTLRPAGERPADPRPADENKFLGRPIHSPGVMYTVQGKGGLVRDVIVPDHLAERLEKLRLDKPETYSDRGVHYERHYAINGGNRWSKSFSDASLRSLGYSYGAHGLRHSYAQERMLTLQVEYNFERDYSLMLVSQEMGHFRPEITETYLR